MLVSLARSTSYSVCPHLLFTEFCESLEDIRKGIEEYIVVKVNTVPKPEVAAEPESKPAVVDELESEIEIEEFLVETSADLLPEVAIELGPSMSAVRVPLP